MLKFRYPECHEEELGGKNLVQLLTDDEYSCCIKFNGKPVAVNYSKNPRIICFNENLSSDRAIVLYLVNSENKTLIRKEGIPFQSPFYDIQKVNFNIETEKIDCSLIRLEDFLNEFVQEGYLVKTDD